MTGSRDAGALPGAADAPDVPSPCIGVCVLDEATRTCIGCGRALTEVAAWSTLSNAQKRAVVARLPDRLEALARSRAAREDRENRENRENREEDRDA